MADSPRDTAEQLLEAQVRYLAAELTPERFSGLLEAELDAWLAVAAQLRLNDVVSVEQIQAVARKYAVSMQIPGSIPEIAAEIAERIVTHPAQQTSRLQDVVARRHVEAFVTKLLELPLVQERLLESPLAVDLVAEWLFRLGQDAAGLNREIAGRIPGLGSLLGGASQLLGAMAPDAAGDVNVRLRELSEQTAKVLLRRARARGGDAWIQDTVLANWEAGAEKPIGSLSEYVTQTDLEDLFILLYEFWLSLRETDYLQALIVAGVAFFFDKYGEETLLGLLEEFGITRADLVEEAQRFAPPIIELLRERGELDAFLRRRLAPFFASPEALAILGANGA